MSPQNLEHPHLRSPNQRDLKRGACDVCKRRKVRCNGETPCQNCVRHGTQCQHTASHGRLAHAERRLSLLQDRLQTLEIAWKRYVPHVDLLDALREVDGETLSSNIRDTSSLDARSDTFEVSRIQEPGSSSKESIVHELAATSPPDSEYEDADTLAWDESTATAAAADGIASLSMDWKGIGYMGPQTGNTLLRKLQSISILYLPSSDEVTPRQSLQPTLPEHTLRSTQFTNQCVDWYFRYFHCAYPILHEGQFRAQLMGAVPKPKDGSWPVLLNTVLALGACSGDKCNENADLYFYREAASHLSWDLLRRGTLSLVQTFALLANYLQKRNRPNSGFTLLGIAMSMAQGIGLHRELSVPAISTFNMEIHRRVWWTLFIFDAAARLTFGRPTLSLGGINTRLPRNLNDDDVTVDLEAIPPSRNIPTITSSLIWQTKLAKIGNAANERLVAKHIPDQASMLALGEEVVHWTDSLPAYMRADYAEPGHEIFTVPRMILLWRSMHLRIIIHRPFLIDHVKQRTRLDFSDPRAPTTCCFNAAEECISSISDFLGNTASHNGSLVWYGCYWLVTAVFVYVICLLYEPQHVAAMEWRQQIENSKAILEFMGSFEPTALRAAQLLGRIQALVPVATDATFLALYEPLRMEIAEELWDQSWADMMVPQEPSPPSLLSGAHLNPSSRLNETA